MDVRRICCGCMLVRMLRCHYATLNLQVKLPGSDAPVVASYVQVRGSIPLLWTELPNLKYKPTKVWGGAEA